MVGGGALLILGLLLYFFQQERADWSPRLEPGLAHPYGTGVFQRRLAQQFDVEVPDRDGLNERLRDTTAPSSAYVFIGQAVLYDSTTLDHLFEFVLDGNVAFLSTKSVPQDLMWELLYDECEDTYWNDYSTHRDSAAVLSLRHPKLTGQGTVGRYLSAPHGYLHYAWNHFEPYFFCEEVGMTALGELNGEYINFARLPYGEGYFYFHTTPLVLSNYPLLDTTAQPYADALIAHLAAHTDRVILDEVNGVTEAFSRRRNERMDNPWDLPDGLDNDTPLSFILDQPSLAWAWYLLLGSGLLYVLFRAKRRQRVIPVVPTNRNTSLDYIQTVGQLYFQREHHKKLIQQQMRLLLRHLRDRYHVATNQLDSRFVEETAARSGIAAAHIQRTLDMFDRIERSGIVTDNTLVDFHRLVDHFYQKGK